MQPPSCVGHVKFSNAMGCTHSTTRYTSLMAYSTGWCQPHSPQPCASRTACRHTAIAPAEAQGSPSALALQQPACCLRLQLPSPLQPSCYCQRLLVPAAALQRVDPVLERPDLQVQPLHVAAQLLHVGQDVPQHVAIAAGPLCLAAAGRLAVALLPAEARAGGWGLRCGVTGDMGWPCCCRGCCGGVRGAGCCAWGMCELSCWHCP